MKLAGTKYVELDCRGLTFVYPDCVSWLIHREANRPLNVFKVSTGLFPLLTGQHPPFKEALDRLKFAYTTDRAGAYVAPASTVLAHLTVAEGDEIFTALLEHIRRCYPEVFGSAVAMGQAPERRELQIGEGE